MSFRKLEVLRGNSLLRSRNLLPIVSCTLMLCRDRFPAQGNVGGDSKIPSVIFYDKAGNVKAVGAEAMLRGTEQTSFKQGWLKAEWYPYLSCLYVYASYFAGSSYI
jgi:hypothetical protein